MLKNKHAQPIFQPIQISFPVLELNSEHWISSKFRSLGSFFIFDYMSYSFLWFLQLRFYHLPVYFSHSSFWFLFLTPTGFDSNLSHAKWHLTLETEIDPTKHVSFNLLLIIPMQMAQNKYTIKIKWTLEDKHPFLNQF